MRLLHPAAWAGFFLNCALVLILFATLNEALLAELDAQERAVMELMQSLRPIVFGILVIQALGLALIAMRFGAGLVVACIGGALMLPAGVVFIVGCVLSHYNIRYFRFFPAPSGYAGARAIFRTAYARRFWIMFGVGAALAFLLFNTGLANFAFLILAFACTAMYLAFRVTTQHPLVLFDTHLTIVPAVMARRVVLPYQAIRAATMFADSSIRFDVDTADGTHSLSWSLNSVEEQSRRAALEALATALTANNVPLL